MQQAALSICANNQYLNDCVNYIFSLVFAFFSILRSVNGIDLESHKSLERFGNTLVLQLKITCETYAMNIWPGLAATRIGPVWSSVFFLWFQIRQLDMLRRIQRKLLVLQLPSSVTTKNKRINNDICGFLCNILRIWTPLNLVSFQKKLNFSTLWTIDRWCTDRWTKNHTFVFSLCIFPFFSLKFPKKKMFHTALFSAIITFLAMPFFSLNSPSVLNIYSECVRVFYI